MNKTGVGLQFTASSSDPDEGQRKAGGLIAQQQQIAGDRMDGLDDLETRTEVGKVPFGNAPDQWRRTFGEKRKASLEIEPKFKLRSSKRNTPPKRKVKLNAHCKVQLPDEIATEPGGQHGYREAPVILDGCNTGANLAPSVARALDWATKEASDGWFLDDCCCFCRSKRRALS
ncbi:hypothetical protein J6590_026765 [Homalodisca vitripennis]|nr:hypothetical protein J6590_026765 [Homalodisca vitripennis]